MSMYSPPEFSEQWYQNGIPERNRGGAEGGGAAGTRHPEPTAAAAPIAAEPADGWDAEDRDMGFVRPTGAEIHDARKQHYPLSVKDIPARPKQKKSMLEKLNPFNWGKRKEAPLLEQDPSKWSGDRRDAGAVERGAGRWGGS